MHNRPRCPASLRALCILALLVSSATAAHAGFFSADSAYAGYRIPEHRWSYWTISAGAFADHRSGTASEREDRRAGASGSLRSNGAWSYDSDRLQHDWGFSVSGAGARSHGEISENDFGAFHSRFSNKDLRQDFSLQGNIRAYPWTTPIGISLGTLHVVDLTQNFGSQHYTNVLPPAKAVSTSGSSTGERQYIGNATAWIGWGHVRDATPVYQAQVLEARLLHDGALTRALSDAARGKVAALFTVQFDLSAAHERSNKHFWRELERILREDGALARESLDAYEVLRVLEPITIGSRVPRSTGFFVGPAVTARTYRNRRTQEQSFSNALYLADTLAATSTGRFESTENNRMDDVLVSFQGELHRPLSTSMQFDALSMVAIQEAGEFPFLRNSLSLAWVVSDRWVVIGSASHQASASGRSRHFARWDVTLNGEIDYFLEDAWALRVLGSEGQSRDPHSFSRGGSVQLVLTWIVSGFFEAPGLVGAMRPAPPIP